jgi:hypothetical protein
MVVVAGSARGERKEENIMGLDSIFEAHICK